MVVLSSKLDVEEAALDADVFVSKGDPPKNLLIALHLMKSEIEEQVTKQVDKSAEVQTAHEAGKPVSERGSSISKFM